MAKSAKSPEVVLTDRIVNQFVKGILDKYESIESKRGAFMNSVRREREGMVALYEGMAARGVSQRATKIMIKIIRLDQKAQGLLADLAVEDRKHCQRMAKLRGDKRQLSLFNDLPKPPKVEKPVATEGASNANGSEGSEAARAA